MTSLYDIPPVSDLARFLLWRDAHFTTQPVTTWDAEFVLPTPSIDEVASAVEVCIARRLSGRAWYSYSRYGKTRTIRYLCSKIQELYPGMPVLCIDACEMTTPSMVGLYGDLLDAGKFALSKASRAGARRNQAFELMHSRAKEGGYQRLVLFVDEAQNWQATEWSWLKTLQNTLEQENITLIVLSFGQEQLPEAIEKISMLGRRDLVARFFRKVFAFRGLKGANDLKALFTQLDTLKFPLDVGPTYTQFFFPQAFEAGWRLADESTKAITHFKPSTLGEYDMESICLAVRHLLLELSEHDSVTWSPTREHWRAAAAEGMPDYA